MVVANQKQKKTAELLQQFNGPLRFGTQPNLCSVYQRDLRNARSFFSALKKIGGIAMKLSTYKSYNELPLFLNAKLVAQALGVSISTAYEVMHEPSFPTLRVGSRMVVPKEKFMRWVEEQSGGVK